MRDTLDLIGQNILEDIIREMVDVYTTTSDVIYINAREPYPASHVRGRYDLIDCDIVKYIINKIRNADICTSASGYIRTMIYNTIKSIDTQYNADARHGR